MYKLQYEITSYERLNTMISIYEKNDDIKYIICNNEQKEHLKECKTKIYNIISKQEFKLLKITYEDYFYTNISSIVTKIKQELKLSNIYDECPICLDVKSCNIGHFNCKHHLCNDYYKLLNNKICMVCRSK